MRVPASMLFLGGIAIICVAAGTGLVIVSSQSRHTLVREDYYSDGLKLDAYRAREAAFDSLGISLTLEEDGRALLLKAGGSSAGDAVVRERFAGFGVALQLRRPDDPAADRDLPLTLASDAPPVWVADSGPLRHGRWNVRAVFSNAEGKPVMEKAFDYDATGQRNDGTTTGLGGN